MKIFILLLLFLPVFKVSTGQPSPAVQADTAANAAGRLSAGIDTQQLLLQNLSRKVDAVKTTADTLAKRLNGSCINRTDRVLNFGEWVLVFSPLALFIAAAIIIVGGSGGLKLGDVLTENELPIIIKDNPLYVQDNVNGGLVSPTIEITDINCPYRPSTSRLIAFITGILTAIIALSITCFFIYHYLKTGCSPDISELSTVILALGLGIVPYLSNKVLSAAAKNKTEE